MSLAIDVAQVRSVLLVDGWHAAAEGSFTVDAYEYVAWDRAGVPERRPGPPGPVGSGRAALGAVVAAADADGADPVVPRWRARPTHQ